MQNRFSVNSISLLVTAEMRTEFSVYRLGSMDVMAYLYKTKSEPEILSTQFMFKYNHCQLVVAITRFPYFVINANSTYIYCTHHSCTKKTISVEKTMCVGILIQVNCSPFRNNNFFKNKCQCEKKLNGV